MLVTMEKYFNTTICFEGRKTFIEVLKELLFEAHGGGNLYSLSD